MSTNFSGRVKLYHIKWPLSSLNHKMWYRKVGTVPSFISSFLNKMKKWQREKWRQEKHLWQRRKYKQKKRAAAKFKKRRSGLRLRIKAWFSIVVAHIKNFIGR